MIYTLLIRLISFVYPIKYKTFYSDYSGVLELTYYNGKLVLDTQNTNYSYGNLQKILDKSINTIYSSDFKSYNQILILGVAGGSVIKTLYDKYKYQNYTDAVDIDPIILYIAKQYFKIEEYKKCNLIVADAKSYVEKCTKKYNLIIIDVFLDDQIPDFIYEKTFIEHIKLIVEVNGFIIFNTMTIANKKNNIESFILNSFKENFSTKILKKIDPYNIIYLIKKHN